MFAFLVVPQKAQFGAQVLYLIEQIEHGFEPGQIEAVNGAQVLDPPHGMNRFFRESRYPIRWLNDGSYKAGTTIDQNGPARSAAASRLYKTAAIG